MRSLVALAAVAAALALAAFAGRAVADGAPSPFKNLQVLPKGIAKDELKAIMKAQSKALGVDCDHCHDMPDPEKDTKTKLIAREMMKMNGELNTKYKKLTDGKVTCDTCHRGKEKPEK